MKLLALPYLALREVVRSMNANELFFLSLCSTKSENVVKAWVRKFDNQYALGVIFIHQSRVKFRNLTTQETTLWPKAVVEEVEEKVQEEVEEQGHEEELVEQEEQKQENKEEDEGEEEEEKEEDEDEEDEEDEENEEDEEDKDKDEEEDEDEDEKEKAISNLLKWVEIALNILGEPRIDALLCLGWSHEWDHKVLKWAKEHVNLIDDVRLAGIQSDGSEVAVELLKLFQNCNTLRIHVRFRDGFVFNVPIVTDMLTIRNGSWFSLDHLWGIQARSVVVFEKTFLAEDVHRFVIDWKTRVRVNETLKFLMIEGEGLNIFEATEDIHHTDMDSERFIRHRIISRDDGIKILQIFEQMRDGELKVHVWFDTVAEEIALLQQIGAELNANAQ